MACDVTSGFQLGCRDNSGGIKSIYILSGNFYQYDLTKNTGDFAETPNPSLENGTVFYSQTVNAAFHKLQASVRNQVKVLAQNPDLKIVVETNNGSEDYVGSFFYIGRYRGATLTGGSGTTGTAFGDANQYALTFEGLEPQPAEEITTSGLLTDALTGITVSY